MLKVCALALGHQGLLHFTYSRWLIAQDTWLESDRLFSLCCKRLSRHGIPGLLEAVRLLKPTNLLRLSRVAGLAA